MKAQEIAEFGAALAREMPGQAAHLTARDAVALMNLARRQSTLAENLCNVANYQETYDKRIAAIRAKVAELMLKYGIKTCEVSGDPRGAAIKLKFNHTAGNSFGGEGFYCVPEGK